MTQPRAIDGNGHTPLAVAMTEADLDAAIQDLCKWLKIWSYHPYDSRRSEPGWPDRCYLGRGGALFRELKSQTGAVSHNQRLVGYRMGAAGLNWNVWRPSDWHHGRIGRELEAIA